MDVGRQLKQQREHYHRVEARVKSTPCGCRTTTSKSYERWPSAATRRSTNWIRTFIVWGVQEMEFQRWLT